MGYARGYTSIVRVRVMVRVRMRIMKSVRFVDATERLGKNVTSIYLMWHVCHVNAM